MDGFTLHHVGVAVRNLMDAMSDYQTLFGYKPQLGPLDDPVQNVSACFMSHGKGDTIVELVAPLGPDSPIDRILKKGGGTYHVCYQVDDINHAIRHMTDNGSFLLSGPVPAIAFEMREIAWLMTGSGLLVELLQSPQSPARAE